MNIEVGDKVELLDAVGGGEIIKIEGDNYYVQIAEDFDIPYKKEKLKLVYKNPKNTFSLEDDLFEEQIDISEEIIHQEEIKNINSSDEKLYLAFSSKNEINPSTIKAYIINNTEYNLLFNCSILVKNKGWSIKNGILKSRTKLYLDKLELISIKSLNFQIIFFNDNQYFLKHPINKNIYLNSSTYHESNYINTDYSTDKTYLIPLTDSDAYLKKLDANEIKNAMLEKNIHQDKSKIFSKNIKPEDTIIEVDLHINKLVDTVVGLSNFEILSIQIKEIQKSIELAIQNNNKKIVFIHGLGNGTLKDKLRETIEAEYSMCAYEEASQKEYGYGATLVSICNKR